jgi:hypothetical protein
VESDVWWRWIVEVYKLEILGVGDDGGRVCMAGDHACVARPQAVMSARGAVTSMYLICATTHILHVSLYKQTRETERGLL